MQIRVNPNLEDGVWGRYVPGENGKDGVYEVSPYVEPEKGLLGVTLHEIFHQGVTADKSLVEYADRIREAMVKSGEISAGRIPVNMLVMSLSMHNLRRGRKLFTPICSRA